MHEISDHFEIRPDPTTDCRVRCLERLKIAWTYSLSPAEELNISLIYVLILAGNEGMH